MAQPGLMPSKNSSSFRSSYKTKSSRKRLRGATGRLSGKFRWRAAIRRVIDNLSWLAESDTFDSKDSQLLDIEHKLILRRPKGMRTESEIASLNQKLGFFKAFRQYPESVKCELLGLASFEAYQPGRTIVRQDRMPEAFYFIISGRVQCDHEYQDPFFPEETKHDVDKYSSGDTFGDMALLYNEPHMCTITVMKPGVEVMVLSRAEFKTVLQSTVLDQWNSIRWAMTHFPQFDKFPEVATRYLCSQSSLIVYGANQLMPVKDNNGIDLASFVLDGTLRVIQRLLVYDNGDEARVQTRFSLYEDQDVKPSEIPDNVRVIFLETCRLSRDAIFGLGDRMSTNYITSDTDLLVLHVPRYILFRYNVANVWSRIVGSHDLSYPTHEDVFEVFIKKRKWAKYRKSVFLSHCVPLKSHVTSIHDSSVTSRAADCYLRTSLLKKIKSMPEYSLANIDIDPDRYSTKKSLFKKRNRILFVDQIS